MIAFNTVVSVLLVNTRDVVNCLPFPCRHLRRIGLVLSCNLLRCLVFAKRLKRYRGLKLI